MGQLQNPEETEEAHGSNEPQIGDDEWKIEGKHSYKVHHSQGSYRKAQSVALRSAVYWIFNAAPDAQDILDGEYSYGKYIECFKMGP